MFENRKSAFLVTAFIAISMPMTSLAADMIQDGRYQAAPQKTYYRTYAAQETTCIRNIVSYRAPYERRTELVTLCHPPLNWQIGPSSATTWSP